jgi:hypothetical protein
VDWADLQAAGEAAERWLRRALVDGDVPGVWPDTDPAFRELQVRDFLETVHGAPLERLPEETRAAAETQFADLVRDTPTHRAWSIFCRDRLMEWRRLWSSFEQAERGPAVLRDDGAIVIAFFSPSPPRLATETGTTIASMNVAMRFSRGRWLMAGTVAHVAWPEA